MSPTWEDYFMGIAATAAIKSKDSTKVGAILVDPEGAVTLTGYNGPPRGVLDTAARRERPVKYMFVSHAEMNLIAFAARRGIPTKGCSVYVTHMCCSICTRLLIQAGIEQVFIGDGTTSMPEEEFVAAAQMFREAGVKMWYIEPGHPPRGMD